MHYPKLTLISHHLCPYVQRAAIALTEHAVPFERRNIDLGNKPEWFRTLSPLGKVPVLVVDDDAVLFESSVIAQYADEIAGGGLLSGTTVEKFTQLAWVEYASQLIASIGRLYNADSQADYDRASSALLEQLQRIEEQLGDGPWFAGESFTLTDAAFAPAFRYFDLIEDLTGNRFFASKLKLDDWRRRLLQRPSVITAVSEDYTARLLSFFAARESTIGRIARNTIAAQRSVA